MCSPDHGWRGGGVVGAPGGGGRRACLLHVLLELLHVALELGAAVLEPADHLQQRGLVTIKRYRVLMFNIDALSHRKQPVHSVQCGCGGGVHVLCWRDNHVVSAPLWRVSPRRRHCRVIEQTSRSHKNLMRGTITPSPAAGATGARDDVYIM